MPKPFYAEQTVVVDGETLRLVINFLAIDATEQLVGLDYDTILAELQKEGALTGLTVKVLWGLLRQHHSDLSLDQVATLIRGEAGLTVGLAVRELLAAAFSTEEKEKDENPPEPRGALSPS
jgi:hypothetical protein